MKLLIDWNKPVRLRLDPSHKQIYILDESKLPSQPGIYIFGRRWGSGTFEAIYVGQTKKKIKKRVCQHLGSVKLMQRLRNAKNGKKIVLAGTLKARPGQNTEKCLRMAERAIIRHFLSEGHELFNQQGARLRFHTVESIGKFPQKFLPKTINLEKR